MDSADLQVFLGKSGSGKSTLCRARYRARPLVLIYDLNAEPVNQQGAHLAHDEAELRTLLIGLQQGRICWRGHLTYTKTEAFEIANRLAWTREDLALVWEEVDRVSSAGYAPELADRIINAGRHRNLSIFACARRPAKVPRDLTANASEVSIFRTTEPRDLAYLEDALPDAQTLSVRQKVQSLPKYHYLHYVDGAEAVEIKASENF